MAVFKIVFANITVATTVVPGLGAFVAIIYIKQWADNCFKTLSNLTL